MSVRKRKWRHKDGSHREKWMIHIEHTLPDGTQRVIRRVSPVQTKRGAESFERELRRQLLEEKREGATAEPEEAHENPETPTLAEFATEFLAYQATLNKATELRAKRSIIGHHLIPAFGGLPLDEIDARAIDRYKVRKLGQPKASASVKSTRRKVDKGLHPKTINNHLGVLGRMLKVAAKWELIDKVPEIEKLAVRKQPFDFLDFEEAERYIAVAHEELPEWYPYVVVAIRSGLRVGEMLGLRWREDVDFERARLRVQRAYTREGGFDSPKSVSSEREVPLTWDAIEALKQQRRTSKGPLVFPNAHGEVGSLRSVGHFVGKVAKLAGMRHVHPHVLRHTFASHAVMRGIPLKLVQEWMGHASVLMTMRYAHLAENVGDDMIKRLAPQLPQVSPSTPPTGRSEAPSRGQKAQAAISAQHNDSTSKLLN